MTAPPDPPDKTYLHYTGEHFDELKALGALWDRKENRWYIDPDQDRAVFKRWLCPTHWPETGKPDYFIDSERAFVTEGVIECWHCRGITPVIGFYIEQGVIDGRVDGEFMVTHITYLDETLQGMLRPWPQYRQYIDAPFGVPSYRNECVYCHAAQDDDRLHMEYGGPFFDGPRTYGVRLTALVGRVRLAGNENWSFG